MSASPSANPSVEIAVDTPESGSARTAGSVSALPPLALDSFEGPLDLLLHLIREHKIDIADIPIVRITDHYLAYLRSMEAMNLSIAGEFIVMAATLLEIKSRMLLPKAPKEEATEEEDGIDPREALVQKLLDYQRYKAFCDTLALWEDERRQVFFRGQADYGDMYELPVAFGEHAPKLLVAALTRLLAEAGVGGHEDVTSVRRQKVTLRLAMASLMRKVDRAGAEGILFDECFERPLIRLEVVMTFLALLELLRQLKIAAVQNEMLGEIRVRLYDPTVDSPPEQAPVDVADASTLAVMDDELIEDIEYTTVEVQVSNSRDDADHADIGVVRQSPAAFNEEDEVGG